MNTYWKKRFSWSKSRQGLLQECPLAYYYNYIARYESGKEASSIASLLKLKKFYFFKGNLIHSAIRNQVTQHCLKRPISLEAAKNFVNLEFKNVSQAQNKYLSEAYNGFPLEEEFLNKQKEDALSQINSFFSVIWHNYKSLQILSHERLESFLLEGFKVWAQPDLVTKNLEDKLIISDWKTGKAESASSDNDLQLSVYILWASIHFAVDIERIGAELVFLKTMQSFPTRRTREQIEDLKSYITGQARKMLAFKSKDEFIPKPRFNLCKGCNFASICPEAAIKKI